MSLASANALIQNDKLRARVQAAIRKTAATKIDADGPAGALAVGGLNRPETYLDPFMVRLATNSDVVGKACAACGDATATADDTIEWIVGDAWDTVAASLFPAEEPTA